MLSATLALNKRLPLAVPTTKSTNSWTAAPPTPIMASPTEPATCILLGKHCQNSIHSLHCPIIVVTVLLAPLITAICHPFIIYHHHSGLFVLFFTFSSSFHLVIYFKILSLIHGDFSCFHHFSSSHLSHLFRQFFIFCHLFTHPLNSH